MEKQRLAATGRANDSLGGFLEFNRFSHALSSTIVF